jgi:hypothetical protein
MRSWILCAVTGAALVSARGAGAQQSVPLDLSGTWVLNIAKSDFDIEDPPKGSDTSVYTRTGNVYEVVQSGAAGRVVYRWPVGTGDVTSDLAEQGAKMHTTTTLKGDTATFTSEILVHGAAFMIETGTEYLSRDGKVLTRKVAHQNMANPNEDLLHFVFVYDKQ